MINNLALLSGSDIPFSQARIVIHQPSLKEISLIGEDTLLRACEILCFSKNLFLKDEDKNVITDKTDFEVFMTIMNNTDKIMKINKVSVNMVLSLLFPNYLIMFDKDKILFQLKDNKQQSQEDMLFINNKNFDIFKTYISEIFCLNDILGDQVFNPAGERSRKIAEKLKKGREKAAATKNQNTANQEISIFGRYVSILSVGLQIPITTLVDYTVYQLLDSFKRYGLKESNDMYFEAKLAGAKDVQEVENWMKDFHSDNDDKVI